MDKNKRDVVEMIEADQLLRANRRPSAIETVIRLRSLTELSEGLPTDELLTLIGRLRASPKIESEARAFAAAPAAASPYGV